VLAYAEVYGWCRGAFAEYPRAAETNPLPKPPNLTFEQSAAVGDSAFTAIAAVRDQGSVRAGQRVLINGASVGVGMFAVQIAEVVRSRRDRRLQHEELGPRAIDRRQGEGHSQGKIVIGL
jgi:NADPH:quinone reductase-like Zn-dependent oxidoreductase